MTRSPLVGRDSEMAVLATCLEAAHHGQPAVVLCRGQPRIDKTRLAQELVASTSARGARSAWGRAVDPEGAPPYWAWRQVLGAIGETIDPHALAEQRWHRRWCWPG